MASPDGFAAAARVLGTRVSQADPGPLVLSVVPGVLLVCTGFGTGTTAVTVAHDMTGSIIDRLRSMNTPATSLITGHVVASTVRNLISTALVFGVAFAIGFRPSAGAPAWLAAIGLLVLFVVA